MRKVPNWSEWFMNIAHAVKERSKDPNTQVGAVVVKDQKVVGTGYNGMPPKMNEDERLWSKPTKYDYVVHAEMNAILNAVDNVKGAKMYITMAPCKDCAKLIAAAGIAEVIYDDDKYLNDVTVDMFKKCGISLRRY